MTTDRKLLRIYLEDHFAGATAGAARARRLAEAEKDSSDAADLATFASDVAQDRDTLRRVMKVLGIPRSGLKTGLASVGEKIGSLKPNGYVINRSPLTTIVELEAMQMAARGKRSLWETIQVGSDLRSAPTIDFDELRARADGQLALLDEIHGRRAATAFAAAEPTGDAKSESDSTEIIRESSDSTVDDWHGQDVQRDTDAADKAVVEAGGDMVEAAELFEKERPEHRADRFNVDAHDREGTPDVPAPTEEHPTGPAMAAHNREVDPPA